HVGEVAAGVGLAVALAPQLLGVADARQKAALLLVAAESDQRRAEQLLADVPQAPGRARAGVLLVEDCLLDERASLAALRPQPARTAPAGGGARALQGAAQLEQRLFVAGTAAPAQGREVTGEVLLDPAARLGAERFFLVREAQVHDASRTCS